MTMLSGISLNSLKMKKINKFIIMRYCIYQLKKDEKIHREFSFMPWEYISNKFSFDNYEKVWDDELKESSNDILENCDKIYAEFNINHPVGFKGHSLSVSDIIGFDNEYYYCNRFGWEKINI